MSVDDDDQQTRSLLALPRREMALGSTSVTLLNIPWEDVTYCYILPLLSLQDLFHLRRVSRGCLQLVTEYFTRQHELDVTAVSNKIRESAFQVATKSSCMLTTLALPNCKWLSDQILKPVFKSNNHLHIVDVSGCQSITANSIKFLASKCPRLEKLILKDCFWQSTDAVEDIARNCKHLTFIDLTSCWQVNDDAICVLATNCLRLEYISLAKIYGVTNQSLIAIAYHCPSLVHLDLFGCWRITDYGVGLIGEYCKKLKTLKVRECRDVSEVSLAALRNHVNIDLPLVPYPYNRAIFLRELGLNVQI